MFSAKLLKFSPFLILTALNLLALSAAHAGGTSGGGGDAATEMRIDGIRADILKWIEAGGSEGLILPQSITSQEYVAKMKAVLGSHQLRTRGVEAKVLNVVLSTVTTEQEAKTQDPEQKVLVGGQYKTCRGFISKIDKKAHILCNAERFAATSEAGQYQLIHHEYAGLAAVERNHGASSDYRISRQLNDFLVPQIVLKLAVQRQSRIATEAVETPTGDHPIQCTNGTYFIQVDADTTQGGDKEIGIITVIDEEAMRQVKLKVEFKDGDRVRDQMGGIGASETYLVAQDDSILIHTIWGAAVQQGDSLANPHRIVSKGRISGNFKIVELKDAPFTCFQNDDI